LHAMAEGAKVCDVQDENKITLQYTESNAQQLSLSVFTYM